LDDDVGAAVIVDPLVARPGERAITELTVEAPVAQGGALKFRARIPPRLPAGRYTGAILDATSRAPKGRLTITVRK
jgi:hypothetical protein